MFRVLAIVALAIFLPSCSTSAHEDEAYPQQQRPVKLSFEFITNGDLYEKIDKEFEEESYIDEIPDNQFIYGIHETDLNADGVMEYIVRLPDPFYKCNEIGCHHGVIAVNGEDVTRLLYVEYTELDISSNTTGGVKDILSYESSLNDFAPTTYKWDSETGRYSKEE